MKKAVLISLEKGEEGKVLYIEGGRRVVRRLADMGITPGTKVKVLKSNSFSPIEILVRNSRLVLGKGVARKIWVEKL